LNNNQSPVKENSIYGSKWNNIHNGYFSDPFVAQPFIEAIQQAIVLSRPTVVADLGGGTGFILKELLKLKELSKLRMINVDVSTLQLSECTDKRITLLQASVDQITREQLQTNKTPLLLFARSLLHYFGDFGLKPLLSHIRKTLEKGELFVHQTACFENKEDAECLNLIYYLMGTSKWYSTLDNLKSILSECGFSIYDIHPATKLQLKSNDLALRYHLNTQQNIFIRTEIEKVYDQKAEVFISSSNDFTAWLHYFIFSCKAN